MLAPSAGSKLNRWVLAALLRDPPEPLSDSAANSLLDLPHIHVVNPLDEMGSEKERGPYLTDHAAEGLKGVRDHLDSWWGELPDDTRADYPLRTESRQPVGTDPSPPTDSTPTAEAAYIKATMNASTA